MKDFKFSAGGSAGDATMAANLGGKGAYLCELCNLGMPVPPGVIIPVELSQLYMVDPSSAEEVLKEWCLTRLPELLSWIEDKVGYRPLVSVRSGAPVSMPGMMDTVLNVGISSGNIEYYQTVLGERLALDCRRRFMEMFGRTVLNISKTEFKYYFDMYAKYKYGLCEAPIISSNLSVIHLKKINGRYLELLNKYNSVVDMPSSVLTGVELQVFLCITAVLRSWMSERALEYRKECTISDGMGTAVTIQAMVYGNRDDKSCSGVLFTRNPDSGERKLYGDFLPKAQGEDVVSGGLKVLSVETDLDIWSHTTYEELLGVGSDLEKRYRDMRDVEFTVDSGKLWLLQDRSGKRTTKAKFKILYDLYKEGELSKEETLERVRLEDFNKLHEVVVSDTFTVKPDVVGVAAGGGVLEGQIVFDAIGVARGMGDYLVLSKYETNPDDFKQMSVCGGILTGTGGKTCHAAVVARGMGKTCVVGCDNLVFDQVDKVIRNNEGKMLASEGDSVVIDGKTGRVWFNTEVPIEQAGGIEEAEIIRSWGVSGIFEDSIIDVTPQHLPSFPVNLVSAIKIDTTWLDGPMDRQEAYEVSGLMHGLMTWIYESKIKSVYLVIGDKTDYLNDCSRMALNMVGEYDTYGQRFLEAKIACLSDPMWYECQATREAITLVMLPTVPQENRNKLKLLGWRVLEVVDTLDTLMDANETISISSRLEHELGGPIIAEKLVNKLKVCNNDLDILCESKSYSQAMAEVFK